ncbi:hypothetical protein GQ44DRAFT_778352 [Phaeosphaeriaceae sp. PMI808]|nr:hypothetical protein GQ44DRAFT_778352 [Phaeosphaeriaceae sp. PMI808]
MAPSSPNLLSLPRELRDCIYSYLTKEVDFNWERDNIIAPRGNEGNVKPIDPVPVRLLNCPLPQVLYLNTRIHEEYLETCLHSLEAVIDPKLHLEASLRFKPRPCRGHQLDLSNDILKRLRHITLFLTLQGRSTQRSLDWEDQLGLLRLITCKAPHLDTLRLAVRQQYRPKISIVPDDVLDAALTPAAKRLNVTLLRRFLPKLPGAIAAMSLIQRGEGYHIGCRGYDTFRVMDSLGAHKIQHDVSKIGVYAYVRDATNTFKRMWYMDEIVAHWPVHEYPAVLLASVSQERAHLIAGFPTRMYEWIERRGVDEVKEWS